jgi:hypothetical protein
MPWSIKTTPEFDAWQVDLSEEQQEALDARIAILETYGPQARRPYVGEIVTSRFKNMKELICDKGGHLRVLFIFDPERNAILLLGGDKTARWEEWYRENVPVADGLYAEYLAECKRQKGERR